MMAALAERYLLALGWLSVYRRNDLSGDLIAGVITAILLVPQAMAYSLLAGLPPEVGLYASIAPPILYAFFGSSRALAVGPVAVASLMVAHALTTIAPPGSPDYITAALTLAAMVGLVLTAMGLARLGFLANFLSHPVMSGFTSAAAIVIAFSQLKHLFGVDAPSNLRIDQLLLHLWQHFTDVKIVALSISLCAIAAILFTRRHLELLLTRVGLPHSFADLLVKAAPLILVAVTAMIAGFWQLDQTGGLAVAGDIPAGLPPLTMPSFDARTWTSLASAAVLIALVSFVESVAIAKALASRRRQKIDPDQELIGLGFANLGAGFTGGSPVCGGFSRSVVNFSAGANTQLAAIVTAGLIALTVTFFTPLFYYLPQAVLAAIIIVSILGLVDVATLVKSWRYDKADAVSLMVTFGAVLIEGIEVGILTGVALSILLYLWRTSRPHIAIVGRVGRSEHFRNIKRHSVTTWPNLLLIRVDESLYFANTRYLEDHLLAAVAERSKIEHVVLICSAINVIDGSALESLETLVRQLRSSGVTLHLAEVKGPVMDKLRRSEFLEKLEPGRVFLSTDNAVSALAAPVGSDDAVSIETLSRTGS